MIATPVAPAKPPTQIAGVIGIEALPIVLTPEPEPAAASRVDFRALADLPSFQMFIHEREPDPKGEDAAEWALACAVEAARKMGPSTFLALYCHWHTVKGYWPNETPFGQVK